MVASICPADCGRVVTSLAWHIKVIHATGPIRPSVEASHGLKIQPELTNIIRHLRRKVVSLTNFISWPCWWCRNRCRRWRGCRSWGILGFWCKLCLWKSLSCMLRSSLHLLIKVTSKFRKEFTKYATYSKPQSPQHNYHLQCLPWLSTDHWCSKCPCQS